MLVALSLTPALFPVRFPELLIFDDWSLTFGLALSRVLTPGWLFLDGWFVGYPVP
jgi:hypothetical protein